MGFVTFIWNTFVRLAGFFGFILIEMCIFGYIYLASIPSIGEGWANALAVVFIIWLLVDTILKIFIGGSASIVKYLWSFTQ